MLTGSIWEGARGAMILSQENCLQMLNDILTEDRKFKVRGDHAA